MDTKHPSAPARAQSPVAGVRHDNVRITSRFTVVGNHLAQHRSLSLTAVGLSTYLQSLPTGTRVDIQTLAARWPEGEARIAAALRELEVHGYLRRERHRTPDGRRGPEPGACRDCRSTRTPHSVTAPGGPDTY